MEKARRRALTWLAGEHLLDDPRALAGIGQGHVLTPLPEVTADNLLDRIELHLPEPARSHTQRVESDDGQTTLLVGGSEIVGAAVLEDEHRQEWALAAVISLLPVEDAGHIHPETVNAINARTAGMLFLQTDDYAAFVTSAVRRMSDVNATWFALIGDLTIETRSRSLLFQKHALGHDIDTSDPLLTYYRSEQMLTAADYDLQDELDVYCRTLPHDLRHLARIRRDEDFSIELPFRAHTGAARLRIRLRHGTPRPDDHAWTPEGLHLRAELPGAFNEPEAVRWCQELNGTASARERDVYATPWLLGNWYTVPARDRNHVLYHGYVSDFLSRRISISEVVDGVIREVWSAMERLELQRAFLDTMTGCGLDV